MKSETFFMVYDAQADRYLTTYRGNGNDVWNDGFIAFPRTFTDQWEVDPSKWDDSAKFKTVGEALIVAKNLESEFLSDGEMAVLDIVSVGVFSETITRAGKVISEKTFAEIKGTGHGVEAYPDEPERDRLTETICEVLAKNPDVPKEKMASLIADAVSAKWIPR